MTRRRLVDPILFQFGIKRLGEARLGKPNDFCAFQPKVTFQIMRLIMLHDRIMSIVREDFVPAVLRDVGRDQHKVQFALAS